MNPFAVVRQFESALCEYTGAKYAVTTNSCTMAILLAVKWWIKGCDPDWGRPPVRIPSRTYVGVPQSIIHAGGDVVFEDLVWAGKYQIYPSPVWDCARMFTSGMYKQNQVQCVSFHASKILGDSQGGAILHDDDDADAWYRRARFDGRTEGAPPKCDVIEEIGYHCYMSPDVAARLLHKLYSLPAHNDPLQCDDYPDLSAFEVFQ